MKRAFLKVGPHSLLLGLTLPALATLACSSPSSTDSDAAGTGGTASSTGGNAAGGTSSTGGMVGSGGLSGTGGLPTGPAAFLASELSTWKFARKAAYAIMHDDTCNENVDNQFDLAAPELEKRGLVATFGAIAADCNSRTGVVARLQSLEKKGHEIANHTRTHQDLGELAVANMTAALSEIDDAHTLLTGWLETPVETFLFPYDSFDDALIAHLESKNYVAVRAGSRGHNGASLPDSSRLNFDVFGPGFSIYAGSGTCGSVQEGDSWSSASKECRAFMLDDYVETVIAAGGFGIRELHSLEGEAWEPVPLTEYQAHLDFLGEKIMAGELWVDTVGRIVRYRLASSACPMPVGTAYGLDFVNPSAECRKVATALSFKVQPLAAGVSIVSAAQGTRPVDVRVVHGATWVSADPSRGPVVFTTSGG